jgi:hypothetical protein
MVSCTSQSGTYSFPQFLLNFVLVQHVLVYLLIHLVVYRENIIEYITNTFVMQHVIQLSMSMNLLGLIPRSCNWVRS